MTRKIITLILFLAMPLASAQGYKEIKNVIMDVNPSTVVLKNKPAIKAKHYRLVEIDINQLRGEFAGVAFRDNPDNGVKTVIRLPMPDGSWHKYTILQNTTMSPGLAEKFPEIKTYDAYGLENPGEFAKVDITPLGFHAMIKQANHDVVFIDPYEQHNTQYYIVYKRKDFIHNKIMRCQYTGQSSKTNHLDLHKNISKNFAPCSLKKYRVAVAATAQYTAYVSGTNPGTVPQALAAIVTTMNRVNQVYEADLAVTMELIPNNNLIIYTDPLTQPYTNGFPPLMIDENQVNITAVIGAGFYDIGHVFYQDIPANASGLAGLGVVCDNTEKARGVTGQANPVGDPFDIDYVAHEMGHQFGANHVQNNPCNRNIPTAVEPGSGSTIMGYAGICAPNVQANSDAYFNGISLQEMDTYIGGEGGSCPVSTPAPTAPVITSTNGNSTVPANTPLSLRAVATNGGSVDPVLYNWEEMDNTPSIQPPVPTATFGPNFRSFTPSTDGTRYFPRLGQPPSIWEVTPSVSRVMNWRITVRGNHPVSGSCSSFRNVTLTTDAGSGPFIVTYPTDPGIVWQGNTIRTVTWDVANTSSAPVNAANVDILLSTDSSQTYPVLVASNIPNTGSASVLVPNIPSTTASIMVRSAARTFFNVSDNDFQITAGGPLPPSSATILSDVTRNPLDNTVVFIYYSQLTSLPNPSFALAGGPEGVTVTLDAAHSRFIVRQFINPRATKVMIQTIIGGSVFTSNEVTVPSIL